ncbi:GNAT family N-acetyltransferase [Planctomycetota bacterium]|nr:GNAT family N-acetyltransferase [Planctomycetota bacterium]
MARNISASHYFLYKASLNMDVRSLRVIEVNETMQKQFEAFCHEFKVDDPAEIHGIGSMAEGRPVENGTTRLYDFFEGIDRSRDHAIGKNLPEGWVPATTYWLIDNAENVHATANLRHQLNDFLELEGGHVGYAVKPSSRGQGCATQFLHVIKLLAHDKGISRLLVTCDKDNIASRRTIENSGGVKENEIVSGLTGKTKQRFWIDL